MRTFAVSRSRSSARTFRGFEERRERERGVVSLPRVRGRHPIMASLVIPYPSHPNISIPWVYNHPSSPSPTSSSSSRPRERRVQPCIIRHDLCLLPASWRCTRAGRAHTYTHTHVHMHTLKRSLLHVRVRKPRLHVSIKPPLIFSPPPCILHSRALEHRVSPLVAVCIRDCAQTAASRYPP